MKSTILSTLLLAFFMTKPATANDSQRFSKEPVTMVTHSGITLKLKYGIDFQNLSSNKPKYVWYIDPIVFQVTGLNPSSKARVVFTNFLNQTSGCGMGTYDFLETYFVDLVQVGDNRIGNLADQGSFVGRDGKSYPAKINAPATRRDPYCISQQSSKQLVALVVDGVWQNAAEVRQNGQTMSIEGDVHDFELHLERN